MKRRKISEDVEKEQPVGSKENRSGCLRSQAKKEFREGGSDQPCPNAPERPGEIKVNN